MAIPHRGWTSNSTYYVTASAYDKQCLLQSDRMAQLFLDVLYHYREQKKYLLHLKPSILALHTAGLKPCSTRFSMRFPIWL